MIKLYDSAFSPFARKVRMALEYKSLNYEAVDGLLKAEPSSTQGREWTYRSPGLDRRRCCRSEFPLSDLVATHIQLVGATSSSAAVSFDILGNMGLVFRVGNLLFLAGS